MADDDATEDSAAALAAKAGPDKRIELVTETADAARQLLVGVALLAAAVIGSPALADAAYGRGPIENALGRFILVLVVCLMAAHFLANMLERAPLPEPDASDDADDGDAAAGDATGSPGERAPERPVSSETR